MFGVSACVLPDGMLRAAHARDGGYADCYTTVVSGAVSQARYVEAFYTTPLFKLERAILATVVAKPSSDAQARELGHGRIDSFAAWQVTERSDAQLLLTDFRGQTRSWLHALAVVDAAPHAPQTRLYFGSAVLPARGREPRRTTLGAGYRALLGLHRLYSCALLASARSRLNHNGR